MALYIIKSNQIKDNSQSGIVLDLGESSLLITSDESVMSELPHVSQGIIQEEPGRHFHNHS